MPTPLRRTLRITRRTIGYGLLVLLIAAAALVSAANLFLPFIENNPVRVKAWLSEQVGQPVQYRSSRTEWTRRGPRISLQGLKVGEGSGMVNIGQAELLVAVYSGLLPGHPLTELKAKGLFLRLEQQLDDRWLLLGVPKQEDSKADALDVLSGFGELQVENSVLQITLKNKAPIRIPRMDMRMRVQGDRLSVGLRAQAKTNGAPVFLVADLDRKRYSGKFWMGASEIQVADWLELAPQWNPPKLFARAELDLWADLSQRRITRVHTRMDVRQLMFRKPEQKSLFNFGNSPPLFDRISLESHWRRGATGWNLHIPAIEFESRNRKQLVSDIRVLTGQGRWQALASAIDIHALAALNPLLGRQMPEMHERLQKSKLQGRLTRLMAYGDDGLKSWTVSGRADGLGMASVGKAPGFQGLAGVFKADQSGGSLTFDASKPVLSWPAAFGRDIASELQGSVQWWKDSADWVVATNDLQWKGDGLQADVDLQLGFHNDGRKPMLNVAAKLAPFGFATAKRFWLRHLMPPSSISWLDMALEKGEVRDASIVVAGDLDSWPFHDKNGRFSARASIQADSFKFAKDWPAAEQASLLADFNGPGFSVTGDALYMGNRLVLEPSGMESFGETELTVVVTSASTLKSLMPVVNNTPLKARLGEAVYSLQGDGPVAVDVALFFPLKSGPDANTVNGSIDFQGASIRAPLWNLAMQKTAGKAVFSHNGFSAEQLSGQIDGHPVKLEIRVGQAYTQDKNNHVEAAIRGTFSTDYLLERDASLNDLKKVLQGRSAWLFKVNSPTEKNQQAAPVFLQAQSDLAGTRIVLPEPLHKPAGQTQSLTMLTQLPVDKGTIELKLGNQFRLLLKKPANKPISGIALFGSQTQGAIPANGFSVRGQTERFDVASWLTLANKAEEGAGLQSFDLTINRLKLIGMEFGKTRLLISPERDGMSIRAQGEQLEGQVKLPKARNAEIRADFKTVRALPVDKKAAAAVPSSPAVPIDFGNPAELPPITLNIQDFRIGDIGFGRCELSTVPSAQGLLIKKFSTQSPWMAINASGLWQGTGALARTSVQANLGSKDVGRMLAAFNYQDVIKGGEAKARFTGAWTGTPLDFSLQGFNGNLTLDVTNGQILGVEPGGGGRVLGLVSLAEIPRRLSLDFSDFLGEGFGFNHIKGQFSFAQGKANTQDLMILAPAADIAITGSTDLVKQRFNQQVQVRAKTGGLLPVLGAVTLGPVGVAAGLVAQAVLDKPLKDSSIIYYEITGPWSKPEVRRLPTEPVTANERTQ
jgi:uncharacterized protein (TIGR02099 family)